MMKNYIKKLEKPFNILVLFGSIVIIAILSLEILDLIPFGDDHYISYIQFWVCMVFIIDFFIRLISKDDKIRFFIRNIFFLIVSIPYSYIAQNMNIQLTETQHIIIRSIPLIRGGYGLAIMIGWITKSRIANLFVSYITSLIAMVYFASIIFYSIEKPLNNMVVNYWDALWWACMDVTTVGSNIYAVTTIGKILSVLLAALGMMMFPIFTAYITTIYQEKKTENKNTITSNTDINK